MVNTYLQITEHLALSANYKKKQVSEQRLRSSNITTSICKKNRSQNGEKIFVKATKLNSIEKTISALPLNGVAFIDKLNPREGTVRTQSTCPNPINYHWNLPILSLHAT